MMKAMKATILWMRQYGRKYLRDLEDGARCADILLQDIAGMTAKDILLQADSVLDASICDAYVSALRRRADGEPIAYILGRKGFYRHDFLVTPDTLIPRPESEWMVEWAVHHPNTCARYIDVCTGSGNIGLSIAAATGVRPLLTDLSKKALLVAEQNALRLGVSADFVVADLFQPLEINNKAVFQGGFSLITCNPPYVPETRIPFLSRDVVQFEPHTALFGGDDGLEVIRRFLLQLPEYLLPGGTALLEIDETQSEEIQRFLATLHGFDHVLRIHQDYAGLDRIVEIQRRSYAGEIKGNC